MQRYLVRRILQMIPLLFLVTLLTYGLMHAAPGGPERILLAGEDPNITAEQVARLREQWGLNDPVYMQYLRWLGNLFRGDLGNSFYNQKPVARVILERMPATMQLNAVVLFLTYAIAIPAGIITAVRQYSAMDYTASTFCFAGHSMPGFWVGLMLIFLVALPSGGLIPTNGYASPDVTLEGSGLAAVLVDRARYMLLPVLTLLVGGLASLTRYTRNAMLEVLREDYVRTARAKGVAEKVVIYRHAFRNALLPVVTLSSHLLAAFFGGSVIVEQVFSWPGVGQVSLRAINQRDYPLVMAFLLVGAVLGMVGNLLVDVIYVLVDPRIKYS